MYKNVVRGKPSGHHRLSSISSSTAFPVAVFAADDQLMPTYCSCEPLNCKKNDLTTKRCTTFHLTFPVIQIKLASNSLGQPITDFFM